MGGSICLQGKDCGSNLSSCGTASLARSGTKELHAMVEGVWVVVTVGALLRVGWGIVC